MANLEVLALDTAVPQIRAPGTGDGYAVPRDMTLSAGTTLTAPAINATTVDATNVEVTNVKAKDGTAALSIADSTGAVTVSSGSTLNGGVVINELGADADTRIESDTNANMLFVDAGVDKVGIGTATFNTNGGVLQVSNGVSFPATQVACSDANTLDDYEEGTWTPRVRNSNLVTTYTLTTANGYYRKVGSQVTIWFGCVSSDNIADPYYLQVDQLPFTPSIDLTMAGTATSTQNTLDRKSTHAISASTVGRLRVSVLAAGGVDTDFTYGDNVAGVATYTA